MPSPVSRDSANGSIATSQLGKPRLEPCLFFCGCLELAQRRHGGGRRVFAVAVFRPSFGFGGVMSLRHVGSCWFGGLGRRALTGAGRANREAPCPHHHHT